MPNIHVATQVLENYGAHDWDGTGECPQYWKPKFGEDYVIRNAPSEKAAHDFVQVKYGRDDEYYREHVCHTSIGTADMPDWKEPIQIEWADRNNDFGCAIAEASAKEAREEMFDYYANN